MFKDKDGSRFNPYLYFDNEAFKRRQQSHIPLFDITDFPVTEKYVNAIARLADSLGSESRWLNGIGVWCSPTTINKIKALPYVREIIPMQGQAITSALSKQSTIKQDDTTLRSLLKRQIGLMQGEKFADKGWNGKGIRIAILDVGFRGVATHPAFDHLFKNHQILSTYDFVHKKENVYTTYPHGTEVLSCIAGKYHDSWMGLAPEAAFLLAKVDRLYILNNPMEDHWVAAAEWADRKGARIISTSLGFSDNKYFYEDMNGHKSLVARGAAIAASKGILVISAAGNEADNDWKYIVTPADGDSVLCIGAVDPYSLLPASYTSFGPSSSHKLKPNVSTSGYALTASDTKYLGDMGTSFATPLIAGFAACIWQMHPTWTNMQVFNKIEESASLYPYFDYSNGYGVPQASFFTDTVMKAPCLISFAEDKDSISITLDSNIVIPANVTDNKNFYLYYHIARADGYLKDYKILQISNHNPVRLPKTLFHPGYTLRASYRAALIEKTF